MSDRVTSLTYRVTIDGKKAIDWGERSWEDDLGSFCFANGTLTVHPKQDFYDPDAADRAIAPRLRAMEIDQLLKHQRRLSFQLKSFVANTPRRVLISVMDRATPVGMPPPDVPIGPQTKPQPPAPPEGLRANDLVEKAVQRWDQFLKGKEPLQGASYFILTLLEAGDRQQASERFRISRNVLVKLGELSSRTGTAQTARKADYEEITPQEERWLKAAIPRIIHRLGEVDVASRPPITMADLPSLKK